MNQKTLCSFLSLFGDLVLNENKHQMHKKVYVYRNLPYNFIVKTPLLNVNKKLVDYDIKKFFMVVFSGKEKVLRKSIFVY